MLESQNRALNLRIDQLSSERDRMASQIAMLESDLKTAVAAKGSLAAEKSSADRRLRVSTAVKCAYLLQILAWSTTRASCLRTLSCTRTVPTYTWR